MPTIAVRREDKPQERRSPVAPQHIAELKRQGVDVVIQSSRHRIFSDQEYVDAGAQVVDDLTPYSIILGIKEIPIEKLEKGKQYLFFSHTIKGQEQNMPLLREVLEDRCTLIDYERICDERGQRIVFFGYYAGLAGMIDTLWAYGQRMNYLGKQTSLSEVQPSHMYADAEAAADELYRIGKAMRREKDVMPLVVGIAGAGNTSRGAQRILGYLGAIELTPTELANDKLDANGMYYTVFEVEDLVATPDGSFDRAEYFQYPYRYDSVFFKYLPKLSILANCIYWEERYPRLLTRAELRRLYREEQPKLQTIGDISCDVRGAIEATVKPTWPDNPVYIYDLDQAVPIDGFKEGLGPVIMAIYNLPAQLPRDASIAFSEMLLPFLPELAASDFSAPADELVLPDAVRRAVIAHDGQLASGYNYLEKFL